MRGCSSTWCASGVAALTSAFLLWGVLACDARPFDPALVVLPAFLLAGLPPSEDRIGDCPSARALVGEACLERSGLAATLPRLLDCPDGGFDVRVEDAFAGAEGAVLRSGEAGSPRLGAADAREGAVLRSGEAGSPRLGAADAREGTEGAVLRSVEAGSPRLGAADVREGAVLRSGEACLERSGLAATLPRLLDCPDGGFDVRVEDAFAGAEGAVLRSGEAGSPRLGAADAREGAVLRSGEAGSPRLGAADAREGTEGAVLRSVEAGSPRLGAADAREGAFEAIGGSCCDRLARAVTCEPVVSMWGGWRGRSDPHQAAPPRERAARAAGQHAAHARTHVSHTHAHTAPLRTHSAAVASRRQCAGRSPRPVLWRSRAKPELRTCNPPGLHGRSPSRVRWPRTPKFVVLTVHFFLKPRSGPVCRAIVTGSD